MLLAIQTVKNGSSYTDAWSSMYYTLQQHVGQSIHGVNPDPKLSLSKEEKQDL